MKVSSIARFVRDPRVNPVPEPVSRVEDFAEPEPARKPRKSSYAPRKRAGRPTIRSQVIAVIEQEPGLTPREIRFRLGGKLDAKQVGSAAIQLMHAGVIKRRMLDGGWRYYPLSYQFSDEAAERRKIGMFPADGATIPALADIPAIVEAEPEPTHEPDQIETPTVSLDSRDTDLVSSLAKEYYWQTGDESLRGFVKWVEGSYEPHRN